ncbi:hypothetical protein AYI69_g2742 [Smittium culicis]|uniref:Uncharacterized protein n=1 Tax=Smittium culicis TaxID=133412 RepID=A0A1R1YLT4_9FUNG|nr:hypothetical protein AYI69_g2742 [Smittium culicis]
MWRKGGGDGWNASSSDRSGVNQEQAGISHARPPFIDVVLDRLVDGLEALQVRVVVAWQPHPECLAVRADDPGPDSAAQQVGPQNHVFDERPDPVYPVVDVQRHAVAAQIRRQRADVDLRIAEISGYRLGPIIAEILVPDYVHKVVADMPLLAQLLKILFVRWHLLWRDFSIRPIRVQLADIPFERLQIDWPPKTPHKLAVRHAR